MTFLKVNLWGREIGRLVWDAARRRSYFMFNAELKDGLPDVAPVLSPIRSRNFLLPIYGDDRPIYQGLPPFIADSLPDSWGNTLFEKWVKDNKIPRNRITPLYKLMFIGSRGMGALEYEPCATELAYNHSVNVKALYDLSLKVLEDRTDAVMDVNEELTMQALLAVGTSAGGRQMKAIIAINDATGEIRSGQTDCPEGFDYYILKFGDASMPIAEIEMAYYKMASAAGVVMEKCRLLPVEGVNHFITKRFDRAEGRKIYVQTLAAINPEAGSYEDLLATCRELMVSEAEIEQVFVRMAFNVLANNTDDHNKNFSFLLDDKGKWHIAPAYDLTFVFNTRGTGPNIERRLSICGKTADITKADLLDFARQNDVRNAVALIDRVAEGIRHFDVLADECGVPQPWCGIIQKTLEDNLIRFGYMDVCNAADMAFHDMYGREVSSLGFAVNAKGYYEVSAVIDGERHRRFVKPGTALYADLSGLNVNKLPLKEQKRLVEALFICR